MPLPLKKLVKPQVSEAVAIAQIYADLIQHKNPLQTISEEFEDFPYSRILQNNSHNILDQDYERNGMSISDFQCDFDGKLCPTM